MSDAALATSFILILCMAGSLFRVAQGPSEADRILGIQLLSTILVALCLTLAVALDRPRLIDLALVIVATSGVTITVFYTMRRSTEGAEPDA